MDNKFPDEATVKRVFEKLMAYDHKYNLKAQAEADNIVKELNLNDCEDDEDWMW